MDLSRTKFARRQGLILLLCVLTAAVFIGLCSRSSPLYPFNDWDDNNCFFTVGKSMLHGRVVYRDIYEQKGVLLYFLYGLAYLVSHTSFAGVYLLETLSFSAFLYLAYRTARLFVSRLPACLMLPCLAAVVCSSYSFFLGGSVEQLCLPLIYLPLYCFLQTAERGEGPLPGKGTVIGLGFAAGCVLWMKYTLLGIYVGYVLFIAVYLLSRREFAALFRAAGQFLLGVLAASAPWLLYFAVNGALKDLFTVYFYNNIFLYTEMEESRLALAMANLKAGILWNSRTSLAIALGFLAALLSKRDWAFKAGLFSLYASCTAFVFISGVAYDYYALALAALAVPGFVFLAWAAQKGAEKLFRRDWPKRRALASVLLYAAILMLGGVFAYRHSVNSFYMAYDREDMWYTRFAETIKASEDKSLLNYGFMDLGLYTLTDLVPETRYFCTLNITLPEMYEAMDEALRERRTAFVLAVSADEPLLTENYELIDSAESIYQFEEVPMTYYLFQRKA